MSQIDLIKQVNDVIDTIKYKKQYTLQTSGTTGKAKIFEKNLIIEMQKKKGGNAKDKWILTYSPLRWAGISVILHAYKHNAQLIIPDSLKIGDIAETSFKHQVTHISLTPSMFRLMAILNLDLLKKTPIVQCTFGGEAATQSVLDLAKNIWNDARISHVYASTEIGDICAVSDGKEGVPIEKFKHFSFNDDELVIHGFKTGDLWELKNNRYYFKGRKQEIINVGGNKVSPLMVEEMAIAAGALQVRVYAEPSPILGAIVALEYVGTISENNLLQELRINLPKYAWPGYIKKVEQINLSSAGKIKRTSITQSKGEGILEIFDETNGRN